MQRICIALCVVTLAGCTAASQIGSSSYTPGASGNAPTEAVTASPSQHPSPTAVASTEPIPILDGWTVLEISRMGSAHGLVEGPDGWLAVGRTEWTGTTWRSSDGSDWELAGSLPPADENAVIGFSEVLATDAGYLILGWHGAYGSDYHRSSIWTSIDGVDLVERPVPPSVNSMRAMIRGGPGFVSVGEVANIDFGAGAQAWWSSDGTAWSTADHIEAAERSGMRDVVVTPDGLIAVGGTRSEDGSIVRPSVWRSTDGRNWSLIANPDPGQAAQQETIAVEVAVRGEVMVAIGYTGGDRDPEARIWLSSDAGATWELVYAGCCDYPHGLITMPGGFVVVEPWYGGTPRGVLVLTSTDGRTWAVAGVLPLGGRESVAGVQYSDVGGLQLWTTDPADGDTDGPSRLYTVPLSLPT